MKPVWKMTIYIALLILFFAVYGGIMDSQLSHIARLVQILHDHPMEVTKDSLTASRDLVAISRDLKDMILVTDPVHQRTLLTEIEFLDRNIAQNMQMASNRILGDEGQALVATANGLIKEEKVFRAKIIKALASGNVKAAAHISHYEGTALMRKIDEVMAKIANYAESRSMAYHVESILTLKRSKIILLSAGFIIVILSVLFVVLVARISLRSLNRPKEALLTSMKQPIIDLTLKLATPSVSGMSQALNDFIMRLHKAMCDIANHCSRLALAVYQSHAEKNQLSHAIDQIMAKLEPLIEKTSTMTENEQHSERNHRILAEMLLQIGGDLNLIAQIAASQALIIDQLKLEKADLPEHASKLLGKLTDQGRSLKEHVEDSSQSIKSLSGILASFATHLTELASLSKEQAKLATDIREFGDLSKAYELQFAQIRDISQQLQKSLESIKL